jgi:hypothetical protein
LVSFVIKNECESIGIIEVTRFVTRNGDLNCDIFKMLTKKRVMLRTKKELWNSLWECSKNVLSQTQM